MTQQADAGLPGQRASHELILELVGFDQRVLDIGCGDGRLGALLKRRGCRVSGVERDPAAAEVAEQTLDEVTLGDVDELDFAAHYGKASFDVVVLDDVLQRVADPVAMLRRVRPLLVESGSVVASIPNVGHGSIRLSLLRGELDHCPGDLVDSGQLRFFTRAAVYEVFREAELVPVDVRRTTAGIFDTGSDLRPGDFPPGVVDAVAGDPESTTYQFVLRAWPEERPDAEDGYRPWRTTAPVPTRIGLWLDLAPDDALAALRLRVTAGELARRLSRAEIRTFAARLASPTGPHDGGLAIEPLGDWSPERVQQLARELDAIVVLGDLPDPTAAGREGGRHPTRFLVQGVEAELDCPLMWSAVRVVGARPDALLHGAGATAYASALRGVAGRTATDDGLDLVPDPLLLVPRVLPAQASGHRLELLRATGGFPARERAIVVEVHGSLLPHAGQVAQALDAAAADVGAAVVLVSVEDRDSGGAAAAQAIAAEMTAAVHRLADDAPIDDVVAVIAAAAAFAACSPSAVALGLAYGVPLAHVDLDGGPMPSGIRAAPAGLAPLIHHADGLRHLIDAERFPPTTRVVAPMQVELDRHFSRIASIAEAAAAARRRATDGRSALPTSEHVVAMELAHRRMRERLHTERHAVAVHLAARRLDHETEMARLRARAEAADTAARTATAEAAEHRRLEEQARAELDRVAAELRALQGTRVLRLLRPARAIYARLRGGRL